jgi:hypothetical protein
LALATAGDEAIAAMDKVVGRVPNLAPDFAPQARALIKQLPEILDRLTGEAYEYAVQVINGAPLHRPAPAPAPEPPAPQIERQRIYFRTPAKWMEGAQTMMAARYSFADPPKSVAELALARGLASLPDAEITKRVIESFGVANGPADAAQCIDLDAIDAPAAEQPAEGLPRTPPMFEERIGEPRQMLVDANRVG